MQKFGFAVIGSVLLFAAQAQASLSGNWVFDYSDPGVQVNQAGGWLLGNNFTVNNTWQFNYEGVFTQDLSVGGGTSPIQIGVYTSLDNGASWTLVNGTLNSIATGDPVDGPHQTTYIKIPTVTLTPGLYSVVTLTTADYNSGVVYPNATSVAFNNWGGALTDGSVDIWNNSPGSLGTSLSSPNFTGPSTSWPWSVPVFGAGTLNAVPEPTTIISGVLMLLPFGASTLRILRRNRTV